jgi:hypothetical protein
VYRSLWREIDERLQSAAAPRPMRADAAASPLYAV